MQAQPANATQAKDRNYMQLGHSLARLSRAIGQTADLCELMRTNLDAMRVLSASHAAQYVPADPRLGCLLTYGLRRFMTVAMELNPDDDDRPDGE